MKIKKIKINAFGTLADREIELSDKINIIYGKNESGKSTLLKFITNIFYGTSKNKKGRFASDYDMFKPWGKQDFSGKINYQLDNGENYEVYREFGKKNPKIYNNNLEEISKQFNIDKNTGNQFFYEQTKIDEDTFKSTFVSMQQEVKLDTQSQNALIQKIANIAGTGEDNISYKKAMEKLNKKQAEEIGTNRTQGRPINVVTQNLSKLQQEKEELSTYKNMKYKIEENKNELEKQIIKNELKMQYLKNIKNALENKKAQQERIEYNNSILAKNDEKIDEINLEINKLENEIKNKKIISEIKKEKTKLNLILSIISILISIIFIITKTYAVVAVFGIISIIFAILHIIKNKKTNKNYEKEKQKNEKINLEKNEIQNKINSKIAERTILEKNNDELENDNENLNNKIINIFEQEKTIIKKHFLEKIKNAKIEENEKNNIIKIIEEYNNLNNNEINYKIENINQEINDKKLELHRMELNNNNILPKLDNLANAEEQLQNLQEEYKELINKNDEIELAKKLLEQAYNKMKSNVTPKFTQNLSQNLQKFSNKKYEKVIINDENGLMVELPNGEYISAEMLSVGTIDQLYLALRLSMVNDISDETLPIILDESFAYFDDERLKNVLKYIAENYENRQVLILTCTSREEKSFNELNIKYNKIIL